MLYGLLVTCLAILGVILILAILIQQSKSSLGIGSMGGENQMLFGGSGGQNIFQKATWVMAFLFMFLTFVLALMKSSLLDTRYIKQLTGPQPAIQEVPQQTPAPATTQDHLVTPEKPATEEAA